MRVLFLLAALTIGLSGCDQKGGQKQSSAETSSPAPDQSVQTPASRPAVTGGETGAPVFPREIDSSDRVPSEVDSAPDNAAVNQRDRNNSKLLPTDQGENESDIQTTAEIRRRIVDLSKISISARNIKIITRDGKVTLRGPVATKEEQQILERIARDVAGQDNLDSQLEVTSP